MSANFLVMISFVVFCYIFAKKLLPGVLEFLDQHILAIKNGFLKRNAAISEQERMKTLYQERLQNLHQETEEMRSLASQKLNFLKTRLDTELEAQYAYRQKSFQYVVHRIQRQQRKTLQTMCVEAILKKVRAELEKNPSFSDEYMVSVLTRNEGDKLQS